MNYEIYKNVRSKEEFLANYNSLNKITESLKNEAYNRYALRCKVLNRDSFKCQNLNCDTPESNLTMHHIKAKAEGGLDFLDNLVIVCRKCHDDYNDAKKALVFSNNSNVPEIIRGKRIKHEKPDKGINWKKIKAESRVFRKQLKYQGLTYKKLEWELILELMKWLMIPYDEFEI